MVTKRTGRPRGRPRRNFFKDPDRYWLALINAAMEIYDLKFEPAARLALCMESRPVPTRKGVCLRRFSQKRLDQAWVLQSFERINPPQATIDARVDTLRLKSKIFATNALAQQWLHNMRNAWINLFRHDRVGPVAELLIFKCCEAAGETRYAKEFMLPVLRDRIALPD